jgi:hypothetical protein
MPGQGGDESNLFTSKAIALVNWNGDKLPDILALGEGPRLSLAATKDRAQPLSNTKSYGPVLYRNQGDGSWKRQDRGTTKAEIFGDSVTVGDFNGDGLPDFAVSSGVQGTKGLVFLARPDGDWQQVDLNIRPGAYVRSVLAVDLNHQGRSDLVVGYLSIEGGQWRSGIDIFYSGSDGTWTRRALAVKDGRAGVNALGAGDLDGDGNLDLVALTGDGDTWVFLADGKGFFTREVATIPNYDHCSGSRVRLADIDGDGKAEIVSAWAGEPSPIYAPDVCRSEGGITAWHVGPPSAMAPPAPSSVPPAPPTAKTPPDSTSRPGATREQP